jgi:hypothetical protein
LRWDRIAKGFSVVTADGINEIDSFFGKKFEAQPKIAAHERQR